MKFIEEWSTKWQVRYNGYENNGNGTRKQTLINDKEKDPIHQR